MSRDIKIIECFPPGVQVKMFGNKLIVADPDRPVRVIDLPEFIASGPEDDSNKPEPATS